MLRWLGAAFAHPVRRLAGTRAGKGDYYLDPVIFEGRPENRYFIYRHPLQQTAPFFQATLANVQAVAASARQAGAAFVLVVAPRYNPKPIVQTVDLNTDGQGWGKSADPVPDRDRIEPPVLDPRVNAVVLRAAGDRAFSTGVDVKEEFVQPDNIWNHSDGGEDLGPKQNKCWKPVICAVQGLAAGGALYWINEADIVICSEDAQFFDPHTTFGLCPTNEPIGLAWMVHPREARPAEMKLLRVDAAWSRQTWRRRYFPTHSGMGREVTRNPNAPWVQFAEQDLR